MEIYFWLFLIVLELWVLEKTATIRANAKQNIKKKMCSMWMQIHNRVGRTRTHRTDRKHSVQRVS